jgi:hypothetical protein
MNRKWITIFLVVGGVILLASVITFIVLQSQGQISLLPTPTPTVPAVPTMDITLPPSLVELADDYPELANILTDPELDSVYKEFLIAYQDGGEEAAMDLAHQRGLLTPDNSAIRLILALDTTDHEPLIEELESIGVTVVSAHEDQVSISIPVELVEAQMESDEPALIFEQLSELEHVIAIRLPVERQHDSSNIPGEGIAVTLADDWHSAGFTGAGVRIGVLDLGFAGVESLEGVELPVDVPLQTFGWIMEDEVHGTACAEIIHEMAPDAELIYAWYDGSDPAMGEAVDYLLSQGVNIISNSTGGAYDPRDGTGWSSRMVDNVAAQGVLWVNSAGNEADAHYRATFTDTDGNGQHEFSAGEEVLGVYVGYGGFRVILTWDESWEYASQDYDLYIYDGSGNVLASSINYQGGSAGHQPVEAFVGDLGENIVYIVVVAAGVDQALPFDLFFSNAEPFIQTPEYSILSPGDAVGSLTVGAANYWNDSLAYYSSQGPTVDGRFKPEISAPTGVSGASYGPADDEGFHGTSASCPHVAGAAALVWQAYPDFTRDEVVDYMLSNAIDLGPSGPDTGYGFGRLQMGDVPGGIAEPVPTVTPIVIGDVTPQPIPTPTPVDYSTPIPQPQPQPGPDGGNALGALTLTVVLLGGMCCLGTGFIMVGVIGLIVLRRRSKSAQPQRRPPQRPTPRSARRRPPPPPQARSARPQQPRPQQPRPQPPRSQPPRPQQPRPQQPPPRQPRQPQSPAVQRCPHCQAPVRPGARFCPKCGNTL